MGRGWHQACPGLTVPEKRQLSPPPYGSLLHMGERLPGSSSIAPRQALCEHLACWRQVRRPLLAPPRARGPSSSTLCSQQLLKPRAPTVSRLAGQGRARPHPHPASSWDRGPDLDRGPQRAADNLTPGLGASAKGVFSSAESGPNGPSLHVSVYFMDFLH